MKKEEVAKILTKVRIVQDWFVEAADREYDVSLEQAQELIEKLEEEDGKK